MICNDKYLHVRPPSHRRGIALWLELHLSLLCFYASLSSLLPFVLSASRSLPGRCLTLLVQRSGHWPFALPCSKNKQTNKKNPLFSNKYNHAQKHSNKKCKPMHAIGTHTCFCLGWFLSPATGYHCHSELPTSYPVCHRKVCQSLWRSLLWWKEGSVELPFHIQSGSGCKKSLLFQMPKCPHILKRNKINLD